MLYRFLETLVCLILPPIYGPRLRQPVMIRAALLPGPAAYRLPRTGKERATFPPQPRPGSVDNQVYVDGQTYALTGGGVQAAINGSAPGTVVIQRATITLGTTGLTVPNNCDVGGVGQAATTLMFRSTAETSFIRNASAGPTNILSAVGSERRKYQRRGSELLPCHIGDGKHRNQSARVKGATNAGTKILEMTSNCVPDQIVISNNVVKGFLTGVTWAALASDGLTHLYIHDNAVEGNTRGLSTDSHSYSSLFCWNNRARRH